MPSHRVQSTDGVGLALHDLGGDGPPVLLCHPTGFHALVWAPLAEHLSARFHCWALDFRGHGDSDLPGPDALGWDRMADDVLATALYLAELAELTEPSATDRDDDPAGQEAPPLLGVGHSMGGAALVLAEQAHPGTVAALWCFEPIVFPPMEGSPPASPLAESARRRRRAFPDRDAAFAHYAAKPPLGGLDPAALRAYVDHGFRDAPDGTVELKCAPETEAGVFESGIDHGGFARLGEVRCPTTVAASGDGGPPAAVAPLVAQALPQGFPESFPELTHFGPMEDPSAVSAAITRAFGAFS